MTPAVTVDSTYIQTRRDRSAPTPSLALRTAARTFQRLPGVDVVWLAVRESRTQRAVICFGDGARSEAGLGLTIEPGTGLGSAALLSGEPSWADITRDGASRLSSDEATLFNREGLKQAMAIPLRALGLRGEARIEGIAYAGARRSVRWSEKTLSVAARVGERVARTVRDAHRISEVTRRWELLSAQLESSDEAPDLRLDSVASEIAVDVRAVLRSGIGMVFRLDAASGALHSLGVSGEVIPGQVVPAVRRGQVLPPRCGCAGRAVALRKTFIASDYASGSLVVPAIMAEAVAILPTLTTMSFPLIVERDVIGAVTVGRVKATAFMDYTDEDVRVAAQLARAAAPLLARAQRAVEHARRQQGASELSRLAGSLTQSLSVSAVCEHLVRSVLALVRGNGAAIWDSHGQTTVARTAPSGILTDSKDPRLVRILEQVIQGRQAFWTPDLANDPRLAGPMVSPSTEHREARAVLVAPVRIRETLLGLLGVTGDTGRAFTETDVELAQALADQAALGIANARACDELQVSNVQLLRHEKLVAMGRLTSGLAHELRNPLQNVIGLTSELVDRSRRNRRGHQRPADSAEYLRRAHAEAKRAAEIVDRLLDYMRERRPAFDMVDMRKLVEEAVAIVAAPASVRGTPITVTGEDVPVFVRADATMLRQVVLNLLSNALDAVERSGEIRVRTRLERNPIARGRVFVSVSDTGRGIPAEHLPHVFELFFTTKEVGRGVGLGLAVCQSLIEQHGGTIRVSSPGVGQGTTVEFELPAEP